MPRTRCPEAAGQANGMHPKVVPKRRVHVGWQPSRQLRRRARHETVRAHPIGSPSCTPTDGSHAQGRGRSTPPRSTSSTTAPNRPRCTPGATTRGQLHRAHRGQHWGRVIAICVNSAVVRGEHHERDCRGGRHSDYGKRRTRRKTDQISTLSSSLCAVAVSAHILAYRLAFPGSQ